MPEAAMKEPEQMECEPVVSGSECRACHWPNGKVGTKGFRGETHIAMPHGTAPNVKVTNVCANCGAPWNLDTVECSTCGWKPKDPDMEDKLIAAKNALLKRMAGSKPLPPREMPIEVASTSKIQMSAAERKKAQEEWDRLYGPDSKDPRDPATGRPV